MSDLNAHCAGCGEIVQEADLQGLIWAEQENRWQGRKVVELLCLECYMAKAWDWDDTGDTELTV